MASPKYVKNVEIYPQALVEQTMNPNSQVRRHMSQGMNRARAEAARMTLMETRTPSNQAIRLWQAYTRRFVSAGDNRATYALSNTKSYAKYVIEGVRGFISPKGSRFLQVGKSQFSRRRGNTLSGDQLQMTRRRQLVRGQRKKDYLRRAVKKTFGRGASI